MRRDSFSTEQLLSRWEDRREIKNLMGKFSNCIILNREQDIFGMFWSGREDVCLGLNHGYYSGKTAIRDYYDAVYKGNCLKARVMRDVFPEQLGEMSDDEIYGIGPFKVKPIGSQVIEIAEDGETAKGIWHCQGAYAEITPSGPVSSWTWGYYAVDFIKEDDCWKIWHILYVNDVDRFCGQSWGKPVEEIPELPEFSALKDFKLPEPNVPVKVWEEYHPLRPLTPAPRVPEEYDTFANTFSYGI